MAALRTLFVAGVVAVTAVSASAEPLFEVVRLKTIYARGCSGDIVELKDGTLLIATHPGQEFMRDGIVARTSKDRGRTWGEEFSLVAPATGGLDHPVPGGGHPSLLRLPNGDILLSYIVVMQTSYWSVSPRASEGKGLLYDAHNYWRRSADEGKSWTCLLYTSDAADE